MRKIFVGTLMVLVAGGCGDDEETPPAASENVAQQLEEARRAVEEAREEAPEAEVDPCTVLTESVVRSEMGIARDVAVEQSRGRVATTLCTYTWPNPDYDPQAAAREIMERVRRGMKRGGTPGAVMEGIGTGNRESFEVTYTHGPRHRSPEVAQQAFERNLERLEEGISRDVEAAGKKTKVTFQMSHTPVEGVGDRAAWNAQQRQLAVPNGAQIFYVSVYAAEEAEQNLEAAKKLARAIIDG